MDKKAQTQVIFWLFIVITFLLVAYILSLPPEYRLALLS